MSTSQQQPVPDNPPTPDEDGARHRAAGPDDGAPDEGGRDDDSADGGTAAGAATEPDPTDPEPAHGRHEAPAEVDGAPAETAETDADDQDGGDVSAPTKVLAAQEGQRVSPPTVVADDAGVRHGDGWVFRGLTVAAEPGELVALVGPVGSGRSTALLAYAGRLRVSDGSVTVLGERAGSSAVLHGAAVARISDVIGLDPSLSVARNARDAADWVGRPTTAAYDLLDRWRDRSGLPLPADRPVAELGALEQVLLHLVLALVGDPAIVVLDDLDSDLTAAERSKAWAWARVAANDGPTVVVSALDPPGEEPADQLVRLGPTDNTATDHEQGEHV